tara:strand:+ start:676 stop:1023 length:348 start_codon:yes stop_codon:yes gene_type:complete
MPIAAVIGNLTTNAHGCNTSVPIDNTPADYLADNTALASGVSIGGVPVAVVGSKLSDHTISSGGSCVPHPSMVVNQGSLTVKVGGNGLAYQGATVSCPGTITGAAGTVSVGTGIP